MDGIATFQGVLRRQHLVGEFNGVTVIEDFAHHPTAVDVTLQGIKEANPNKRIICIYEPRSNTSRRAFFQNDYIKSFSHADLIVLLEVKDAGTYSDTTSEIITLDVKKLVDDLNKQGKKAFSFLDTESILEYLKKEAKKNDLVVVMSNGDFGGIIKKLPGIF